MEKNLDSSNEQTNNTIINLNEINASSMTFEKSEPQNNIEQKKISEKETKNNTLELTLIYESFVPITIEETKLYFEFLLNNRDNFANPDRLCNINKNSDITEETISKKYNSDSKLFENSKIFQDYKTNINMKSFFYLSWKKYK